MDLFRSAQYRTSGDDRVRADFSMAGNHDMRDKLDTVAQSDLVSHTAERTYVNARA